MLSGYMRSEWALLVYAASGALFFFAVLFILATESILPRLIRLLPQTWSVHIARFMCELRSLLKTPTGRYIIQHSTKAIIEFAKQ